jgi:hypothetical protein
MGTRQPVGDDDAHLRPAYAATGCAGIDAMADSAHPMDGLYTDGSSCGSVSWRLVEPRRAEWVTAC